MTRLQKILSGLLALQLVATLLVFWPDAADSAESQPLLADFDAEAVSAITLENRAGDRTRLLRQGSGWILDDSDGYPADAEKIEPLLAKIGAIQTGRLVASSSSSHKRLQVAQDDFSARITLETGDDDDQEMLLVGTAPNPRGTHVRLANQDNTYLTGEIASWEVNPDLSNWLDATYISLDRNSVVSIVLENANGTLTFEKANDGSWSLSDLGEGEVFEATAFNTLLSRVTSMRLSAPLGTSATPDYGLAETPAVVTIVSEDQESQSTQTHTLEIGQASPEGDTYFVKWSDSDYFATVASFNVESMVNHTRDDFIQAPPTPAPDALLDEAATPEPES